MSTYVSEYFKCDERHAPFALDLPPSGDNGFFRIGNATIGFGQLSKGQPAPSLVDNLIDTLDSASVHSGSIVLPFNISQVIDNLRHELYAKIQSPKAVSIVNLILEKGYYLARPLLHQSIRRHVQRLWLNNWRSIPFPQWPIDSTVDCIFEELLLLALKANNLKHIPFIWFWPNKAPACAILTHDVETTAGLNFCPRLMDLNDAYRIKSSFFLVPEKRYLLTEAIIESIRRRGFEANIHDLNHDGQLFRDRNTFLARSAQINAYGRRFQAAGFRSGALYRNPLWMSNLEFRYDMSIPTVGHLEPQRGGCCTVMPYFIGGILELPLTTTQDYALFNYLKTYSLDLWKMQVETIIKKHGLVSFLIHPDYIIAQREQETYRSLLAYLSQLREDKKVWITTSGDVDRWWRQRANMKLVDHGNVIQIEGEGSEQASIAYAREEQGQLVYSFSSNA